MKEKDFKEAAEIMERVNTILLALAHLDVKNPGDTRVQLQTLFAGTSTFIGIPFADARGVIMRRLDFEYRAAKKIDFDLEIARQAKTISEVNGCRAEKQHWFARNIFGEHLGSSYPSKEEAIKAHPHAKVIG